MMWGCKYNKLIWFQFLSLLSLCWWLTLYTGSYFKIYKCHCTNSDCPIRDWVHHDTWYLHIVSFMPFLPLLPRGEGDVGLSRITLCTEYYNMYCIVYILMSSCSVGRWRCTIIKDSQPTLMFAYSTAVQWHSFAAFYTKISVFYTGFS